MTPDHIRVAGHLYRRAEQNRYAQHEELTGLLADANDALQDAQAILYDAAQLAPGIATKIEEAQEAIAVGNRIVHDELLLKFR